MDACPFSALFSALLFLTRGLTVRFFTDDTNVMAEGSRIITMLAFFYPTFCCGGAFLRDARLQAERHADGPDAVRHVSAAAGTAVFVTFPHFE